MTLEEVTTLKEAIKRLKEVIKEVRSTIQPFLYDNEAKDYILKALEKEPCEDAVSRQEVKEQMIKYGFHASDMTVTEFAEDHLSPVNPHKIGHWIIDKEKLGYYISKCSACGHIFHGNEILIYRPKYCANCGAKMVEEQETEQALAYADQNTLMSAT